jgi:hypothetical protein
VSSLFKIAALELFADDLFITRLNLSIIKAHKRHEEGFVCDNKMVQRIRHEVNQAKTEESLFYIQDAAPI